MRANLLLEEFTEISGLDLLNAAVEAALIEARRRVRLNEEQSGG